MTKAQAQKLADSIMDIYSDEITLEINKIKSEQPAEIKKHLSNELYKSLLNDINVASPIWYLMCKINEFPKENQSQEEKEFSMLLTNQLAVGRDGQNKEFSKVRASKQIFSIIEMLSEEEEELFLLYYRDNLSKEQIIQRYDISIDTLRTRLNRLRKKIVYLYNINYSDVPPIKYRLSHVCIVDVQHNAIYLNKRIVSFPIKEHYWDSIKALINAKLGFSFLSEYQMCKIAGIVYSSESSKKIVHLATGLNRYLGKGIVTKKPMGYTLKNFPERIPNEIP